MTTKSEENSGFSCPAHLLVGVRDEKLKKKKNYIKSEHTLSAENPRGTWDNCYYKIVKLPLNRNVYTNPSAKKFYVLSFRLK